MDGDLQSLHAVQNIDNHFVSLTNLQEESVSIKHKH
jgi:hypothetical protein